MDYPHRYGFDKVSLKIARNKARRPRPWAELLLVIIFIAASFLGGVFVNGPGLQWVQARVLRSLGLSNAGEIVSISLESTANSTTITDSKIIAKPEAEPSQTPPGSISTLLSEAAAKHNLPDQSSVAKNAHEIL